MKCKAKEGLADISLAKPSFGMTLTTVNSQYHTKRSLAWAGASQASFWYDNNKDLETYFSVKQPIRFLYTRWKQSVNICFMLSQLMTPLLEMSQ